MSGYYYNILQFPAPRTLVPPTFLNSLILTLSIPFRLLLPILELDRLGI